MQDGQSGRRLSGRSRPVCDPAMAVCRKPDRNAGENSVHLLINGIRILPTNLQSLVIIPATTGKKMTLYNQTGCFGVKKGRQTRYIACLPAIWCCQYGVANTGLQCGITMRDSVPACHNEPLLSNLTMLSFGVAGMNFWNCCTIFRRDSSGGQCAWQASLPKNCRGVVNTAHPHP